MAKQWLGSTTCDGCGQRVQSVPGAIIVDGKTRSGQWMTACKSCAPQHGILTYGTGLAQKYQWDDKLNGFVKILG